MIPASPYMKPKLFFSKMQYQINAKFCFALPHFLISVENVSITSRFNTYKVKKKASALVIQPVII